MANEPGPQPATPRPAATVLLVRQGAVGFEVLLMQRPLTMRFLPGYWAFPGGALDEADAQPDALARVAGAAPGPGKGERLAALVAAAREVFEETGVLLAQPAGGGPLPNDLSTWRQRLRQQAAAFPELLRTHDLCVPAGEMRYLHRWMTRPGRPIRFDARFFVAALPPGQTVDPSASELAAVTWRHPAAALQAWREGNLPIVDATQDSLGKLAAIGSMDGVTAQLPPAAVLAADAVWNAEPFSRRL